MSTPIVQQPPPIEEVTQQAYTTHTGHGSVGPVIAVLAVIAVLGVLAGMIGRLCSGRRIMGHGEYDFENWVETKCSSCVDGRIAPPTPPPQQPAAAAPETSSGEDATTAQPEEGPHEIKKEVEEQPKESSHGHS